MGRDVVKPGQLDEAVIEPAHAGDVIEELADVQFDDKENPDEEHRNNRP